MQGSALIEGRRYALREKRSAGSPLLKVKLIAKVGRKGMVKIRYEDGPHPGLEEYVRTTKLVVAWSDRAAFLRNEQRHAALDAYARDHRDPAVEEAVSTVLAASGEPSAGAWGGGVTMSEAELRRIMARAGLEGSPADLHPLGFCDPSGDVHLPLESGETIARAFAAAEPETVTMYIDDRESELKHGGYTPGERYRHDLLRQYLPGFAIARQWAGFDQDRERLENEIARLRTLISIAASDLRNAGQERKATRLMRGLEGR
jgi:hypothetical protein